MPARPISPPSRAATATAWRGEEQIVCEWPYNADGDVFRRLLETGFDFSTRQKIDFNVDFAHWPPAQIAVERLRKHYPDLAVIDPEDGAKGYLHFTVSDLVTYELVTRIQCEATSLAERFGGACNSWGVMSGENKQ